VLFAVLVVVGYLAGSIPAGYWLVRVAKGVDIRTVGSGNVGATNVWRTFGRNYGLPVMLFDVAKGLAPALVATLTVSHLAGVLAGAAAMIGHARPLFMRFQKGGKMVATTGGAILGVAPLVGAAAIGVFLVVFLLGRYVSVASIVATASLAPIAAALGEPWPVIVMGAVAFVAVVILHRSNIQRLRSGTESRANLRRRKGSSSAAPSA
jgi:glycerol-3-phosphate acyltransferase PlsY